MKQRLRKLLLQILAVVMMISVGAVNAPVQTSVQASRHYHHRRHYHLRHKRHYRHRSHHYHHTAYYWAHHKKANKPSTKHRVRRTIKKRVTHHKRRVVRRRNAKATTKPTAQQLAYIYRQVKGQMPSMKANGHGAFIVDNNHALLTAKNSMKEFAANTTNKNGTPAVANAFLTKHSRQYKNRQQTGNGRTNWVPLGWHQLTHLSGSYHVAYNRGHLLGYALVGNVAHYNASEANKKNIVTQTAWANQAASATNTGQNYYEGIVRKALDKNKKVRYQVKPVYDKAHHNLVPYGVQIQAKSTDGSVNFNVFVPNVQGNININYRTGKASRR